MNKSSFFIVGKHAVIEALKNPNRKVLRIFLTEESKKIIHRKNQGRNLLKNLKVFFKTRKELDKYCKNAGILHQGFVAEVEHLEELELKEFIKKKNNLTFACLNEVTDPRNIGSIIRSATSFNIDGIIIKGNSFQSESKLLYKSASGSMEYINIFEVSNINTTLKFLKTKNFWASAFDKDGENNFTEHDWNGRNVLLFGSEGYGLKYQTTKNSDFLLKININENTESLNISNSAAVVFHFLNYLKR